jgi:Fur family iron response transcriptional regulator
MLIENNIGGKAKMFDRLAKAGFRPTRKRRALASLLFDGDNRHVTAEQLHGEALAAAFKVSLATIYNTLNLFTNSGLLREIVVEPGSSFFDTNTAEHYHFYFEETHQLVDIPGDMVVLSYLPVPPAGTSISRVDLIIRIRTARTVLA